MNLRKSVIRLLLATGFLLLVAWVAMQVMQNGGNFDAFLQKGKDFANEKFGGAVEFFQEKLTPVFQDMAEKAQQFTGKTTPQ